MESKSELVQLLQTRLPVESGAAFEAVYFVKLAQEL